MSITQAQDTVRGTPAISDLHSDTYADSTYVKFAQDGWEHTTWLARCDLQPAWGATVDVDILITDESLRVFKAAWLGRGYVDGSRGVRDTELGVGIDFVIAGHYPGDGKPKPVRFPDPALVARRGESVALLPISKLVELKLASGMSSLDRAKDLADIVELIRHVALPRELATELDASVRDKYLEGWDAVASSVSIE